MKKLAIKGHNTRYREVINILKMLGGKDVGYAGKCYTYYYYIDDRSNNIEGTTKINKDNEYKIFTLEEFLKKYPFKVGDKVMDGYSNSLTIKSMSWHSGFQTVVYNFKETEYFLCAEDIEVSNDDNTKPTKMKNVLSELLEHIKTTPKDELEREFEEIKEWSNVGPTIEEFRTFCECVNKKPKHPKTFEECLNMLYCKSVLKPIIGHKAKLLFNLEKLLICRDAYWKIVGEQMGLGKLWEPNWNEETDKFTISNKCNKIYLNNTAWYAEVLSFPTAEMRDAFYKNFKDLIEQCKELL